ncbi:DNA-processing protein DprA [Comamonas badia]|uniref:DNA-processing protein DprA n=1 Tax=Comamonas badia TaxID=265291 RepID=UPI00041DA19E|nr:DNA-processing protein DprA [Comamonas badia]
MQREELAAWLRLTTARGLGPRTVRRLLARFGLPQAVLTHAVHDWADCIGEAQAQALQAHTGDALQPLVERAWQWLQGRGAASRAILTLADPAYPRLLLETEDPPVLLYLEGAAPLFNVRRFFPEHSMAIVGSRNPTAQGALNARQFGQALREAGLSIVSGLARGVDAAAHEGALAARADAATPATIAVVGTGLDQVYPRAHEALAARIRESGLLVSEYPLGTPPLAANFPRRNRIISGLSQGTLVVEAALASGSLITARLASEQGRDVFAIPGSIHAPQSRGCHALIRQGAKLVETAQDILEELQLAGAPQPAVPSEPASAPATHDPVLQALGFDPASLDALLDRTGFDTATLQLRLLELELDGSVARLPGGLFQRVAGA